MRGPFAKVIGMTAEPFMNIEEDQQKFTNDDFMLINLELAEGENDEGDAVSPPAKKANKATAGKT